MTANRKWKANGKTKHFWRESKQNYARHVRTSICAVCKGISMYSVYIAMADSVCQRLFRPLSCSYVRIRPMGALSGLSSKHIRPPRQSHASVDLCCSSIGRYPAADRLANLPSIPAQFRCACVGWRGERSLVLRTELGSRLPGKRGHVKYEPLSWILEKFSLKLLGVRPSWFFISFTFAQQTCNASFTVKLGFACILCLATSFECTVAHY